MSDKQDTSDKEAEAAPKAPPSGKVSDDIKAWTRRELDLHKAGQSEETRKQINP